MIRGKASKRILEVTTQVKKSYLWNYETKTVIQYARIGDCYICGLCCQGRISFSVVGTLEENNPESGGRATSEEGVWVESSPNGQRIFYKMKDYERCNVQCKKLEGDGKCGAYLERSTLCMEWPFSPMDLTPFPECSYSFIEIGRWSFEEIIKTNKAKAGTEEKLLREAVF